MTIANIDSAAESSRNITPAFLVFQMLESIIPVRPFSAEGEPSSLMANTTAETGAAPAPKSLPARFIGIIMSPRDTFASVAANPKWLGMLVLTTLIVMVCAVLPMTTDPIPLAAPAV